MDKREFIKTGVMGSLGLAASAASGAVIEAEAPAELSVTALKDLRAVVQSERAHSILSQVELLTQAIGSAQDRAMFIADPVTFAYQRGVVIDPGFAQVMRGEMRKVEARATATISQARSGAATTITLSKEEAVFPLVMAVAAVVSAVSAVVSAVSITYMATRWEEQY